MGILNGSAVWVLVRSMPDGAEFLDWNFSMMQPNEIWDWWTSQVAAGKVSCADVFPAVGVVKVRVAEIERIDWSKADMRAGLLGHKKESR
jgi:hypothetical protein